MQGYLHGTLHTALREQAISGVDSIPDNGFIVHLVDDNLLEQAVYSKKYFREIYSSFVMQYRKDLIATPQGNKKWVISSPSNKL